MESASPLSRAASAISSASSNESVFVSRYFVSRRFWIRVPSTSTQIAIPPFIVTASGCAPQIGRASCRERREGPRRRASGHDERGRGGSGGGDAGGGGRGGGRGGR